MAFENTHSSIIIADRFFELGITVGPGYVDHRRFAHAIFAPARIEGRLGIDGIDAAITRMSWRRRQGTGAIPGGRVRGCR